MKVTVIGAGSTYTPELVSGLAQQHHRLPIQELVLMDTDGPRLEVVGGLARRMLTAQGLPVKVRLTTSRSEALDGADAVLIQLRVGGQKARLGDETFPGECGCLGQETTGAGGAAKALRTVPVILDIADEARRRGAPGVRIIDFTNPVGIVTRSLLDAGHDNALGLCNFAIGVQRWAAGALGVAADRVAVDPVGLNHFSWVRRVLLDGEDVLPRMLDQHMDKIVERYGFPADLLGDLGAIPSYYLRYYYFHDQVVAEQREQPPRAQVVADVERTLLEMYADESLTERPALLEKRGGAYYSEAAVALLAAAVTDSGETHVVNVRNNGTIAGLADDDVIEVPCRIDAAGATPLPQAPLPDEMRGPVQAVTAYERLISRAAVTGEERLLRKALLTHPLIGQYPLVQGLVPRLLSTGAEHLTRFSGVRNGV
ncbi:6-phospho-beta-glucosidase [Streptomyces sp. NPDC059639]|uniref:6-phospho-beta-glucosidase n=1 Tax=Streptomyces sp. NPDC059639 TaxID=3346891 RepID=UPI00369ABACD